MRNIFLSCLGFFLLSSCLLAAVVTAEAAVPDWLTRELQDPAKLRTPGVYPLSQNRLLAVGVGRVSKQLREDRARRLAAILSENDAKAHLARHLFGDAMRKEPNRRFTVNIVGAMKVSEVNAGDKVIVAILTETRAVTLAPLSPLADCYDVRVAPLVERLLEQDPMLAEGGGAIFPQGQGWVAMGVGFAALSARPDAEAERRARIVAAANARKELTEAIFGSSVSNQERYQEIVFAGPGGDKLREWVKTTKKEEVRGFFQGAEQAGVWQTDDEHVGVAVLIAAPPIRLASEEVVNVDKLPNFGMEEEWEKAFLQRPWMIGGGAGLAVHEGAAYLLVVESAPLQGDPRQDKTQTPVLIETKASSAVNRYLAGVQSDSLTVDTEERSLSALGTEEKATLRNSLRQVIREGGLGAVQGMRQVGSWRSEDNRVLFQAYVVPLPGDR